MLELTDKMIIRNGHSLKLYSMSDVFLTGLFILLSFAFFPYEIFYASSNGVAECQITVFRASENASGYGKELVRHKKSGIYEIDGNLGKSRIEFDEAGRVRFLDSACPNHVCVNSGWSSSYFALSCVPNGVVAEVKTSEKPKLDGISR
ncbi:MAG: NusG domain II-containing protein [Candidatus Riflebacteria bacterium]|nr:NusG domain II-containing protein [Candidatus Riflebacteria bacterium]